MTSESAVQAAESALEAGDWRRANEILLDIDDEDLSEADRLRVAELRALTGRVPAAVGVAAGLGTLLLVIVVLLYVWI